MITFDLRKSNNGYAKHGLCGSSSYVSWYNLRQRCLNSDSPNYHNYGGRGIFICKRWIKFKNFYKDMGPRPKGTSIDRIDNNGDYNPKNCRWATPKEQGRNTRLTNILCYKGEEKPLLEWAEIFKIKKRTLFGRVFDHGWSVERALLTKPWKICPFCRMPFKRIGKHLVFNHGQRKHRKKVAT